MTSNTRLTEVFSPASSALTATHGADYLLDALERSALFMDTLRRRGNAYLEHLDAGEPALLKFEHELIVDGRLLERPCNYALLHILPPPDAPIDPRARAVVVVDPRAGHGPGIGGFKKDSEVGVAMRAGHPVYFVTFRPEPEEGQNLGDVMQAEAQFLEVVAARHPHSQGKPVVIGNCQAGWAVACLAAVRPELFGPTLIVGAPLSYWAGGAKLNPMRYSGATLGGAWLAALSADLGGDRFDGACLVQNFEKLNPANTLWGKYYGLWSKVDSEAERFLEFERWWGGYFRMTGAEIETIVENLFVGNRLARGTVVAGDTRIDLRNISAPVVVFASWGDNITPPPQALNWIIDTWGSERAITAAGRVIVYVLHESVGHLGIFVSADIARKEHAQIVNSLDVIDHLPPGLYEMRLVNSGEVPQHAGNTAPGPYSVSFEHRTMEDLRAVNPEGRKDEELFSTVAKVSEINTFLYKVLLRPWLRLLPLRQLGDAAVHLHPLRWQRRMFCDAHPAAAGIAALARQVRAQRHALPDDHPARVLEQQVSGMVETTLNLYRDLRDQAVTHWTRMVFGPLGLGAWLPPEPSDEVRAVARADAELEATRREVLAHIAEGGLARAVCRIVLAGMVNAGTFQRRSFRLAQLLARLRLADSRPIDSHREIDWTALLRDEARIAAVAPDEALLALADMLPDVAAREHALALAAAVAMIDPEAQGPQCEVIAVLMETLGVDADQVIGLTRRLLAPVARPALERSACAARSLIPD